LEEVLYQKPGCKTSDDPLQDGKTVVSAQDPLAAFSVVANPAVAPVANEARERLVRVIESLRS
jgi:hypothetical protein